MTVPPIINVIVSASTGQQVVVAEIAQNITGIVVDSSSFIQTNVFSGPAASAQHAYNATTASYSHTASWAAFADVTSGVLESSSYSRYAEVADSASWASHSFSSSYAPGTFPYTGDASIAGTLAVTDTVTTNKLALDAGNGIFVITGSITQGIFGVTEDIHPVIPTASFSGATIEYMAQRPGGIRLGNIMALWSGSIYRFTDISTTDIGDTSDIIAGFLPVGENIIFQVHSAGSGSDAWTVQAMFKLFPKLT